MVLCSTTHITRKHKDESYIRKLGSALKCKWQVVGYLVSWLVYCEPVKRVNYGFMMPVSSHPSLTLQGQSVTVLKVLFEEIMEIFTDEYIHIGADETGYSRKCNFNSKMTVLWPAC